jgi:putative transposase
LTPKFRPQLKVENQTPFYGWPRMTAFLRGQGEAINHQHVQRLMPVMGLHAGYPPLRTPRNASGHNVYPYWLRGVSPMRPNHVGSAEITYIPTVVHFGVN